MKTIFLSFLATLLLLTTGCANRSMLSSGEIEKLDPALQKLLTEENVSDADYSVNQQSDGIKLYGVLIRGASRSEVQKLGIHVNSSFGDLITAKVTTEQLKSIVKLDSVYSVKNSIKSFPQQK